MTAFVPVLLEDRLKDRGYVCSKGTNWTSYIQVDGRLVTGQNQASSGPADRALLNCMALFESDPMKKLPQVACFDTAFHETMPRAWAWRDHLNPTRR